jgi:hypothetical protein
MVSTQIEAGTRGDLDASMALYADTVDFFDEGLKPREAIAKDMLEYFAHWPVRRSRLVGDITIENISTNERQVGYTLDFEASNPGKELPRRNLVAVTWIVRRPGPWSAFKIVSHKQKSLSQEKPAAPAEDDQAIGAVKKYFAALNAQDATTAYRLFSAAFHARKSFQEYSKILKNTGTLTLQSISRTTPPGTSATVEVTFQELEPKGKVIQWRGPIGLVLESGEWKIDSLRGLKSDRR